MKDESYMKQALMLAGKGVGWVNPNPLVGALVVKNGKIIGEGYHRKYGEAHAERNAFASCSESPQGATLYVTLEPCCHFGKTPPCTQAVLENGIQRVVVGAQDPNPLVAGKGIQMLRQHGVEVAEGVLKVECERLNTVFFHYIRTQTPYVVMKYAMTMDGKIATYTGKSKWITGEAARQHVQQDRHRYSAIMVGVGTVFEDNPMLTCRLPGGRSPIRIICDTHLRTPLQSQIVQTAAEYQTMIATCCTDSFKIQQYQNAGCEVLVLPLKKSHVDLNALMQELGKKGIDSILLEGGGTLNWSALNSGIVQKTQVYIAPKLFGGTGAKSPIGGLGVQVPAQAVRLSPPKIIVLEEDVLLESEVLACLQESLKKSERSAK